MTGTGTGTEPDPEPDPDLAERERREPPPFLGSWRRLYAAVLLNLALVVLLLWWVTRAYS